MKKHRESLPAGVAVATVSSFAGHYVVKQCRDRVEEVGVGNQVIGAMIDAMVALVVDALTIAGIDPGSSVGKFSGSGAPKIGGHFKRQ